MATAHDDRHSEFRTSESLVRGITPPSTELQEAKLKLGQNKFNSSDLILVSSDRSSRLEEIADREAVRLVEQSQIFRPTRFADNGTDRFYAERELGEGGFGTVYDAKDLLRDGLRVALKVLRDPTPLKLRRFAREGLIAKEMHHPNIAEVYDVGTLGKALFISMEFLPIPTRNLRFDTDWKKAVNIVISAIDGLVYAHEVAGVIHRDIKPDNILLSEDEIPKIVDWGLARSKDNLTYSLTVQDRTLGTLRYIPPEQIGSKDEEESIKRAKENGTLKEGWGANIRKFLSRTDEKSGVQAPDGNDRISDRIDERSDIYSMGITLAEYLNAPLEFGTMSLVDVNEYIRRIADPNWTFDLFPRDFNRNIPEELEWIILKATHKDPALRYQTAREFQADLKRVLDGDLRNLTASSTDFKRHGRIRWRQKHPKLTLAKRVAPGVLGIAVLSSATGIAYMNATDDLRKINQNLDSASEMILQIDIQGTDFGAKYRTSIAAEEMLVEQREAIRSLISSGQDADKFKSAETELQKLLLDSGEMSLITARDWFNNATEYQDMRNAALAYATRLAKDRILDWFDTPGVLPKDGSIPVVGEENGEAWQKTGTNLDFNVINYLRLLRIAKDLTGNQKFAEQLEDCLRRPQVADLLADDEITAINNAGGALGTRGHLFSQLGKTELAFRLAQKLSERVMENGVLHYSSGAKDTKLLRTKYLDNLYVLIDALLMNNVSEQDKAKFRSIVDTTLDFVGNNVFDGNDVAQAYDLEAKTVAGTTSPLDRAVALEMFTYAAQHVDYDRFAPIATQIFNTIQNSQIEDSDILGLARTAYALAYHATVMPDEQGKSARLGAINLLRRIKLNLDSETLVPNSNYNKSHTDNPDMRALRFYIEALRELSRTYADDN